MKRELEEKQYRVYVTDCLRLAPQGKYMNERFYDIISKAQIEQEEPEAILERIIKEAELEVIR